VGRQSEPTKEPLMHYPFLSGMRWEYRGVKDADPCAPWSR
jgi:hypothetical protein